MGNRPRLDPGVKEQVDGYLTEVLTGQGYVTGEQVQLVSDMIHRSERSVWRYVDQVAAKLGIDNPRSPEAEEPSKEVLTGLDALLDGQSFSFAEEDVKCATVAYFGNLAALHRDACAAAQQLHLDGPLSYPQLTRKFNAEVPQDQRRLIRHGVEGFRASSMYVRWSAEERNEVWQIDATQLDLWIRPKGTSKRIRPWVLLVIDDRSRVILAASLLLHEYTAADAAACVHQAMRLSEITLPDGQTIQVGGLPEKILCDNAQQFTGEVLSHVAQILGFVMWAVAAYAGEKKGKVERTIRIANEDFARKLPGYANRDHKTFTQKDTLHAADIDLLNEQPVLDEFGKWVEAYNNSPHPTVPGKSRYQVWADSEVGLVKVDEELLLPATVALPRSSYTFSKDGFRVQRQGFKFYYLDLSETVQVGTRYHLRHLPGDTDWVDVYDLDGEFLVRCWDTEVIPIETKKQVDKRRQESYREISSLRSKAVALRSQAVDAVSDSDERPNVLVAAHQKELAVDSNEMIRASLRGPVRDPALEQTEPDPDTTSADTDATSPAALAGRTDAEPQQAGEKRPPKKRAGKATSSADVAQLAADAVAEALDQREEGVG